MEQQKLEFIEEVLKSDRPFCEICDKHEISRKTGYKWYSRFLDKGKEGLKELSRAPHTHPNVIDQSSVKIIISIKNQFPYWGPRKIHARIKSHHQEIELPSKSSVENVLKNNNLVCQRIKRRRVPATAPLSHCAGVNEIWCYDFKGWFLTGNGEKCEPLTITDAHSRYLLKCVSMKRKTVEDVWKVCDAAFREYGLPLRVRSDNGPPFATTGVGRLSRLSILLIKVGITPEWITPGKPQENGRHERFHLTLKKETASPPAQTLTAQERIFKDFQCYYNNDRPHEALEQNVPSSVYTLSPRQWDGKLRLPEYDDHYEKRKVMKCGCIAWLGKNYFLSETLYGEYIGLKQIDAGVFEIYYGSILLGIVDVRKGFKKRARCGT
jgi:transposase InsO family protein